ncbi:MULTISPECIES: NrfD/PsrC family molybdoenzyme membrane anchor subunit [unclassified Pseudonocardia]|uniref:NrfD/PsrC family molybdoenzyme membrane anchor subunit n=1 Tax=unclassified Pseudonocardia TaxID=2619320 RepID=UPI0011AE3D2F|nr:MULTISPECIES: NrfD/PsrC family molybdoenzyme membrane anchor subunit [unclassified Pseudonocardia]
MFQGGRRRRRRRGGGRGEESMVPEAEFSSYYGRAVLKPPVWEHKIAYYLFCGGLAAGTAVVGAGADLTGRPALRRASRAGALGGLVASTYFLVSDLGRPERFHHMLRVAKPTSPMSVGTWILAVFGPAAGLAGTAELTGALPPRVRRSWPVRLLDALARPAGLGAAATAPALCTYTAVLFSHTAVPGWNEVRDELPFVFAGSAAASGGGFGMLAAPVAEAGPARAFAVLGAAGELVAGKIMERRMGIIREAYEHGHAGRLRKASEACTAAGLAGTLLLGRRSRAGAAASGLALLAGSLLQRLSVFEAGVETTKDPRYVVVPQRERLARRAAESAEA